MISITILYLRNENKVIKFYTKETTLIFLIYYIIQLFTSLNLCRSFPVSPDLKSPEMRIKSEKTFEYDEELSFILYIKFLFSFWDSDKT